MRHNAIFALCLFIAASAIGGENPAPEDCTVAISCKVERRPFFGTGSVISPQGYILTSTTVVPPGATQIIVLLSGEFQATAAIVGIDESLELALLRIEPPEGRPLDHFVIRKSSSVELGEIVMTVSNLPRLAWSRPELSVSVGLLSGRYNLARQLAPQPVFIGEVLETTAATNPGSDGGPLLDGSGRLIGMLSLNVCDARWLGCAVPIDALLPHVQDLIKENLKNRGGEAADIRTVDRRGEPLFPAWEERAARFRSAAATVKSVVVALEVERVADEPRFLRAVPRGMTGLFMQELHARPKCAVTGVIVDANGWIATTYYNIAGELKGVTVILPDGRKLDATIIGWDQERDLALLKVNATKLPVIELADDAELGEYVCALGRSPEPDRLTLTAGILSAVGRDGNTRLQFDAKANIGNTGGPLIGLDGKCYGIVNGVTPVSAQGQNSGVAFALWGQALRDTIEELRGGARIARRPRAAIGVALARGPADLRGVFIAQVMDGSAAASAGLKARDVITKVDDIDTDVEEQIINHVRSKKPGDKVTLTLRRNAREFIVEITLGEAQ